ncbi:MAG: porin family protein [Bryobacteraceae bacterium]|jgi:hypothetical protein|nr:porin family protein [Bryobacteraceae bacterium]
MIKIRQLMMAAVLACGTVCFGQALEAGVSGGGSLLRNNLLTTVDTGTASVPVSLKDGFRIALRLTLNTYRFFGHEGGYAYNRTKLDLGAFGEPGMAIHQGFYNFLVYATPEGTGVRPFATGGVHFNNFVPPGASVQTGGGVTKFGLNYGGGIKARISPMFLMRFDVRQYHTPKPDFFVGPEPQGWLRQLEVSAGLAFTL